MQWDDSPQAGFTSGTPWLSVNPRYPEINAKRDLSSEKSVFHFYQKLIRLRKESDLLVFGDYCQVEYPDERIISHTRQWNGRKLTVIVNYSDAVIPFADPMAGAECFLKNYDRVDAAALHPYEARIYLSGNM